MRKQWLVMGAIGVALNSWMIACGSESTGSNSGAASEKDVGSLELNLLGQGSLGGQYQLTNATFTITGTTTATVSGDPDTVRQSLPIGTYTVRLGPGWTLRRVTDGGSTNVSATLASTNPQSVVINGSQTSTVGWAFNVSGANAETDDLEIVTVGNGAVAMTMTEAETGWSNFSAGSGHTCAITTAGALKCWGANSYGQLGYGDNTSRYTPAATTINVGVGRTVQRVTTGPSFTCALLDDATLKCWGNNNYGQLGYGDSAARTWPPEPVINLGSSNTARTMAVGSDFACVILDSNAVKCWGRNNSGQLGYGDTVSRSAPAAAPISLGAANGAKSIEAGQSFACAILTDDTVKCWGDNTYGELGYGDTTARLVPPDAAINLGVGRTARRVATGLQHTCAILDDNTVKCWGYNSNGQLGYGDTVNRLVPPDAIVNLGAGRTAKRIAAGTAHTCAILDDDTIKCWGYNAYGQLGYEDTNQRSAPPALLVNLGAGRVARRVLASEYHTCVLLTDNAIKCWGYGTGGVFGTGNTGTEIRGDQLLEMGDYMPEVLP